jgi:hypothetical protein
MCLLFAAFLFWTAWLTSLACTTHLASSHLDRLGLYVTPPLCLLVLALCQTREKALSPLTWSEWEGWSFPAEAAFLAAASWWFPWWGWGLSPRDDVAERGNRWAGWAIGGALLGLAALCGSVSRAFSSIVNPLSLFSCFLLVVLAACLFFLAWGVLEKLARLSDAITVERDGGAALRLGAFLLALGLLLGLALHELRARTAIRRAYGDLLVVAPGGLLLLAIFIECYCRMKGPSPKVGPAVGDVVVTIVYLSGAGLVVAVAR